MAVEEFAGVIPGQRDLEGGEVPIPPENMEVRGPSRLEQYSLGGKLPTSATVTLAGGKVDLTHGTAFEKGDVVTFHVTAIVDEVTQKDRADKATGIVMSCEQGHKARVIDIRLVA